MAILRLIALRCNTKEDYTGHDDIYMNVNGNREYGKETFKKDQSRAINKDVLFTSRAEVRLYEYDDDSPDDFLGTVTALKDDASRGELKYNFSNSGASYDLWYIVYPDQVRYTEAQIQGLMML